MRAYSSQILYPILAITLLISSCAAHENDINDDDVIPDDNPEDMLPDVIEAVSKKPVVLDDMDESDIIKLMQEETQPQNENILEYAKSTADTQIEERTHALLDVQYGIRMTGMWSAYHLEPPRSMRMLDILKLLFSPKNQTLLQGMVDKAKEQKMAKEPEAPPQSTIDGTANEQPANPKAEGSDKLELVLPLDDEAFLENIHYEDRDDMGIDISALAVAEKTFPRFPGFYFNPRIHCFSPFQNETIICTTRPVAF